MLKDGYRETRFRELAKKEGVPDSRVERTLKDKGVPSIHLLFDLCFSTSIIIFKPNLPCRFQVPTVFSFLDVHPDKGLNEDVVELACKNMLLSFIRLAFKSFNFGQMQEEVNTHFALMWLPSFAVDPPTSMETKASLGSPRCHPRSLDQPAHHTPCLQEALVDVAIKHRLVESKVVNCEVIETDLQLSLCIFTVAKDHPYCPSEMTLLLWSYYVF